VGERHYGQLQQARWDEGRFCCLGLDPVYDRLPVVWDAKDSDVIETILAAVAAFAYIGGDAITLNPWMGFEPLAPYFENETKGCFIVCRSSNRGAGDIQDRLTRLSPAEAKRWGLEWGTELRVYELVAYRVARDLNTRGNLGLVAGGTNTTALETIRGIAGQTPLLVPGLGEQGGQIEQIMKVAKDDHGRGVIVSSSRAALYAYQFYPDLPPEDFAEATRKKLIEIHEGATMALSVRG
jgi:orotidine-5'-phosphate decarboxylase